MQDQERMWEEVAEVIEEIGSEREVDFIEDIESRARRGSLSDKQLEWLEDLYRRACDSPY